YGRLGVVWEQRFCRPETSFSQGVRWKTLIARYIVAIPPNGEALCTVRQSMSGAWLFRTPVSKARIAKVGAAASDSQLAARRAAAFRWIATSSDPPAQLSLMPSRPYRGTPP